MKTQTYRLNNFIEKEIRAQMFSFEFWKICLNTFLEVTFGRLLLHKHLLSLLSHHDLLVFQKWCHTYSPSEYFLSLIHRLGIRVSSIFQTLCQTPIFNAVEHLWWRLKPLSIFAKKMFFAEVRPGSKIGFESSHWKL